MSQYLALPIRNYDTQSNVSFIRIVSHMRKNNKTYYGHYLTRNLLNQNRTAASAGGSRNACGVHKQSSWITVSYCIVYPRSTSVRACNPTVQPKGDSENGLYNRWAVTECVHHAIHGIPSALRRWSVSR